MKIKFMYSFAHLKKSLWPVHGPQVWPWWRLITPSLVKIEVHAPSSGWRLWLYTRFGAIHFDVYFDRRGQK